MHASNFRTVCLALLITLTGGCSDTETPETVQAPLEEAASEASKTGADAESFEVRITAVVPTDSPQVYLSGNLPERGPWNPGLYKMDGTGSKRTATLRVPAGHALQYKVTAGSWEREGLGPSGTVMPAFTANVSMDMELTANIEGFRVDPREHIANWQGAQTKGSLVYWTDVESRHLKSPRHVVTLLPPGYDANAQKRYKVIYMHDGQNLFDPRIAYTGVDWGVDEAMQRGVENGEYEPAIIVGIWNTTERLFEYSPWHDAPNYAKFLLEELMPRVNAEFKVLSGPQNTFTMGSSMGGLMSLYLVQNFPETFGACGCVSTHVSWSPQMIEWFMGRDPTQADPTPYLIKDIQAGASMPAGQRLYFDYGTQGLDAAYHEPHQALGEWLDAQGFVEGETYKIQRFDGADHNEASWRERVDQQLAWLLSK